MMGVGQGQVGVGLVLGMPCESSALFCWGSGAHWGLHFLGSIPQCGALRTLVDGEGVRESGVSLGSLALPVGFPHGSPQCGALGLLPFYHIPLLVYGLSDH